MNEHELAKQIRALQFEIAELKRKGPHGIGYDTWQAASGNHNHDSDYAASDHLHSGVYSLVDHSHNNLLTLLSTPLTSTSWDGDSFSSVATPTLINLNSVFGAPAGISGALMYIAVRDSASAANDCYLSLYPANTGSAPCVVTCAGKPNDVYERAGPLLVPCNADGNLYYQCVASGVNTLDIIIRIWGYTIPV